MNLYKIINYFSKEVVAIVSRKKDAVAIVSTDSEQPLIIEKETK